MSARNWTAGLTAAAVLLTVWVSLLGESGEHKTFARLNPATGKMEIIDPRLLPTLTAASVPTPSGRTKSKGPGSGPASLAEARLMDRPAIEPVHFVE